MIRGSPKQLQAALHAILTGQGSNKSLHTGDAYLSYNRFCSEVELDPITQRAFSDLIYELDMYGFIRARTVSRGRHGRSKEIHVGLDQKVKTSLINRIRENFDLSQRGVF